MLVCRSAEDTLTSGSPVVLDRHISSIQNTYRGCESSVAIGQVEMKSVKSRRQVLVYSCVALSAMMVGCGKSKQPWEVAHPAVGVVKMDGKPLAGAQITLVPEDKSFPDTVRPRGFTDASGAFELSTYGENDGAPKGKYKLVAMRFPVVGSAENPSQGPNNLPPKYARADTSDVTVEIASDENVLNGLELRR